MKKRGVILIVFALSLLFSTQVCAQLLDDEDDNTFSSGITNTDDDALFDEMFSEFSETEKDVTKVKTFDDAISALAQSVEKKESQPEEEWKPAEIQPLQGEMFIGIKKGSFRIFRDMSGRTRCAFDVVLKSELEKAIKTMGLNLIYPNRSFAFVFRDVPPNDRQIRRITTSGDICYTMSTPPDININLCKIKETLASDCIKHIKWSDTLE